MAITVQVPVVVEMTGEQVSDYAAEFGLQIPGYRTKDIVDHVGTKAEARRVAKAAGWAHVRSPLGAVYAKDYCPAHRPQTSQEG